MRKRIFGLILSCVVLCVCAFGTFAVAYAEVPTGPINYMDLDYTVKEGAAYNQVTVPIPVECLYLGIYNQSANVATLRGRSSLIYTVEPGLSYTFKVYPFSVDGLLLDNIPEGTTLNFTLRVDVEGTENFYIPSLYGSHYYKDISGNRIGNEIMAKFDGTIGEVVHISYELKEFPNGAYSFVPVFRYGNFGTAFDGSARYTFTVSDVSLSMNISNGYWEQWLAEQNGQMIDDLGDRLEGAINDSTNEITGAIDDSTDKITGTLEDQWNADIEPQKPVGSDKVDGADQAESEVRDNAQVGLDKGNELQSNASSILKSADVALAFACVAKLFGLFADISFFSDLLTISVALGVFSLLVNLANSASAWRRRETAKAEREQRRQEAAERYSRRKH